MHARMTATAATLLMVALGMTGCAATGQVTPGTRPPAATAGPGAGSASDGATTFGTGTSLGYRCDQLLPPSIVSALDPKLAASSDYTPEVGSPAAEAVFLDGTACRWTNADASSILLISAADPDAATLATLKSSASSGTPSTGFGADVSASQSANGELQLFTADGFWATISGSAASDSTVRHRIGMDVLEALPAG